MARAYGVLPLNDPLTRCLLFVPLFIQLIQNLHRNTVAGAGGMASVLAHPFLVYLVRARFASLCVCAAEVLSIKGHFRMLGELPCEVLSACTSCPTRLPAHPQSPRHAHLHPSENPPARSPAHPLSLSCRPPLSKQMSPPPLQGNISFPIFILHGALGQLFYKKVIAAKVGGRRALLGADCWVRWSSLLVLCALGAGCFVPCHGATAGGREEGGECASTTSRGGRRGAGPGRAS